MLKQSAALHNMGMRGFCPQTGEFAEERSFVKGYRGAWFRCKINEVAGKRYRTKIHLEYYDFDGDKLHSAMLYRRPNRSKDAKVELMFRPRYPPICRESELLDSNIISEEVVILKDSWKVGDLVDWWCDNCYWSGRLTEALGDDKFQIQLLPPPDGEGLFYEVPGKDLRPSLDWTPEHGWKVPNPMVNDNCQSCARIIKPLNPGESSKLTGDAADEEGADLGETARASIEHRKETENHSKSTRREGNISLISLHSEASILDLEKLLDRVKQMKHILQSGTSSANSMPPSWKFVEHRTSMLK